MAPKTRSYQAALASTSVTVGEKWWMPVIAGALSLMGGQSARARSPLFDAGPQLGEQLLDRLALGQTAGDVGEVVGGVPACLHAREQAIGLDARIDDAVADAG